MTNRTTPLPPAYHALRELAKTLNLQMMELSHSVAEVRYRLYEEARGIKKSSEQQGRQVSRRSIDPITVFHSKEGRSTVVGHECTETTVTQEPRDSARE